MLSDRTKLASTHSKSYFILRGKILQATTGATNFTLVNCALEAEEAHKAGELVDEEYSQILDCIKNGMTGSEEYRRLLLVIQEKLKQGTSDKMREGLLEEIALAWESGLIHANEREELMSALDTVTEVENNPKTISFSSNRLSKAYDTPAMRRRRERSSKHSEGYDELVDDYRNLFTEESMMNVEGNKRKFFQKVAYFYQEGIITIKEFRDFHAALDDDSAYLDTIDIDCDSQAFAKFRDAFLEMMSTDTEIMEVIKQIASWSKGRGVSEVAVNHNIIKVATDNLDSFMQSGNMLVTASARERTTIQIKNLKLS